MAGQRPGCAPPACLRSESLQRGRGEQASASTWANAWAPAAPRSPPVGAGDVSLSSVICAAAVDKEPGPLLAGTGHPPGGARELAGLSLHLSEEDEAIWRGGVGASLSPGLWGRCSCQPVQGPRARGGSPQGQPGSPTLWEGPGPLPGPDLRGWPPADGAEACARGRGGAGFEEQLWSCARGQLRCEGPGKVARPTG